MILLISIVVLGAVLLTYFSYFLFMNRIQKMRINWKSSKLDAKVSLIIATYNEEATIGKKLENVLEQDYPKEQLELVIMDSGSKDRTPEIVEDFIKQNPIMNVVFIREPERLGKSHAINIAYGRAKGEIKIISDADAILEKSALTRIVGNFADPTIGAACGRQVLLNPGQSPSTMMEKSYRNIYEVLRKGESILDSTPIFHGELSAYRANLIELLPENKSADDSRLANIIRRKGYRAVYDSTAIFYEYAPPNSNSRIVQKVRRGQGLIRVFWDFRRSLFNRKYGKYGTIVLPMEFFMHCVFPALLLVSLGVFLVAIAFYNFVLLIFPAALLFGMLALSRLKSNNYGLAKLRSISSLFFSFLSSQLLLFYGLCLWLSGRSLHKWQKVDDIRQEWQDKKT